MYSSLTFRPSARCWAKRILWASGQSTDLPRIRFHDLWRSHATQLLASGVRREVAQERLGHSSVGITLDLYSHVLPGMQEDAAAKVDAAIRAAIDRAGGVSVAKGWQTRLSHPHADWESPIFSKRWKDGRVV